MKINFKLISFGFILYFYITERYCFYKNFVNTSKEEFSSINIITGINISCNTNNEESFFKHHLIRIPGLMRLLNYLFTRSIESCNQENDSGNINFTKGYIDLNRLLIFIAIFYDISIFSSILIFIKNETNLFSAILVADSSIKILNSFLNQLFTSDFNLFNKLLSDLLHVLLELIDSIINFWSMDKYFALNLGILGFLAIHIVFRNSIEPSNSIQEINCISCIEKLEKIEQVIDNEIAENFDPPSEFESKNEYFKSKQIIIDDYNIVKKSSRPSTPSNKRKIEYNF